MARASLPRDLRELTDEAPAYLPELLALKAEVEHGPVVGPSVEMLERDVVRLQVLLDEAEAASKLPEAPSAAPALNDLLVRTRLAAH